MPVFDKNHMPAFDWRILFIALFFVPLIFSTSLTDPVMVSKSLYFQVSLGVLLLVSALRGLFYKTKVNIQINAVDIGVILLLVFATAQVYTITRQTGVSLLQYNYLCYLIGYLLFRFGLFQGAKKPLNPLWILAIICVIAGYESILALYNRFGASGTGFLSGHWMNEGIFAIYLAVVWPVCLAGVLNLQYPKWSRYTSGVSAAFILLVLLLSTSRTAWVAGFLSSAFVLSIRYGMFKEVKRFLSSRTRSIISGALLVTLLGVASVWLYQYKKASSVGRLYIYEHSLGIIADNPIFGVGIDRFVLAINDSQAKAYSNHPKMDAQAYAAGDTEYASNEFLHLGAEQGLIALLVFLGIIGLIIYYSLKSPQHTHHAEWLGLFLSVLISCQFSYPLHDPAIAILFFVSLAFLSSAFVPSFTTIAFNANYRRVLMVACLIVIVSFLIGRVAYTQAEIKWTNSYRQLSAGDPAKALETYKDLYPVLNSSRYFLLNYGAELVNRGMPDQGVPILHEAEKLLNDESVALFLADGYRQLEKPEQAEQYLTRAMHLIPYRFMTRYNLVITLDQLGKQDEAVKLARETIKTKPKIEQQKVEEIKADLKNYVQHVSNP